MSAKASAPARKPTPRSPFEPRPDGARTRTTSRPPPAGRRLAGALAPQQLENPGIAFARSPGAHSSSRSNGIRSLQPARGRPRLISSTVAIWWSPTSGRGFERGIDVKQPARRSRFHLTCSLPFEIALWVTLIPNGVSVRFINHPFHYEPSHFRFVPCRGRRRRRHQFRLSSPPNPNRRIRVGIIGCGWYAGVNYEAMVRNARRRGRFAVRRKRAFCSNPR